MSEEMMSLRPAAREGMRGFDLPRLARLLVLAASLVLCVGCFGEAPEADSVLVVTGSSTIAPVTAELAKAFEAKRPGVRIDVQSGGSGRGISDARNGLAQIGMVSRALRPEENDLHVITVARDGVGLILHADNPVAELSRAQVISLYRGEVDRWSALGGEPERPVIIHKADGRATQQVFLSFFGLDGGEILADVIVGENEQAIKTAIGNSHSIAYVSIGSAQMNIDHGAPLKLMRVDGVEASLETLRAGRYPLSRPLNFVLKEPPTGLAAEFIDFVRSEDARPAFEAQSFVQAER